MWRNAGKHDSVKGDKLIMDDQATELLQQINAAAASTTAAELTTILTRYRRQLENGDKVSLVSLKLSAQLRHYLRDHAAAPEAVTQLAATAHATAEAARGQQGKSRWYV